MAESESSADKAAEGSSGAGSEAHGAARRLGSKPSVRPPADEAASSAASARTLAIDPDGIVETSPDPTTFPPVPLALPVHAEVHSKSTPRVYADVRSKSTPQLDTKARDLAGDILWLATEGAFDATPPLDRSVGDEAADVWATVADRVRRGDAGELAHKEAVIACVALAASSSERARALAVGLADEVRDPVLLRLLSSNAHAAPEEVRLEGELVAAPRGFVATTLLALSGILFVVHAARLVARLALAYRRPAEVSLSDAGVRVKTRTEMLGRTLREREHVILRTGLVRVVREVRFPRSAFYAGLFALAIGSYVGVRTLVDGVRAASPSLLVVGLLIVGIGIGADFVLGTLLPGSRGRCRVAFIPRTGPVVCIGDVDIRRADDALARSLARRS